MGGDSSRYLMSLVLAVLFADTAHERPGLAAILQTHKLDSVDLVLGTQRLLVRFVSQRDAAVFGQRAGGVCELRTLSTEVCGTHRAVHRRSVALVLITPYDALQERRLIRNHFRNCYRNLYTSRADFSSSGTTGRKPHKDLVYPGS